MIISMQVEAAVLYPGARPTVLRIRMRFVMDLSEFLSCVEHNSGLRSSILMDLVI